MCTYSHVMRDWKKITYICVRDSTQNLEKMLISFKSRANGMVIVEWLNDLNQELKTQKFTCLVQIRQIHDSSHWFESDKSRIYM